MADTFTSMEHQLSGKLEALASKDEMLVRRAVRKFAKRRKGNQLEVEVELLEALGLGVVA